MRRVERRNRLNPIVMAVALALVPLGAGAAGLGKLNVLSALGQPLSAELDMTATRDELSSLAAHLAPPAAFSQAGIEYAPALSGIRFSVERRPNGQPFLRITSDRVLNEPYLDLLVELTWAQGRLVREYTFLLDPPEALNKPATTGVAVPSARPSAAAAEKPVEPSGPAAVETPDTAARGKPVAPGTGERLVKRGDTLGRIANETKPGGVNLDQMLVALLQGNRGAFDANNMHRLRAGKVLNIPDAETVQAVDAGAARKIVVAQSADFNAYRRKLAAAVATAAPPKEAVPAQSTAGKIAPQVEDKAAAAAGKDKLQVATTAQAEKGAAGGRPGSGEEARIAKEKEIKEAKERIAALEKNIGDLRKLNDMNSQAMADLQKQAQVAKPGAAPVAPPPKAEEAAKPAKPAEPAEPPPKPAEPAEPPPKAAEVAKPAEPAAKPVEPGPKAEVAAGSSATMVKAAEPADAAAKPAALPKPVVAPPPAAEPIFVDDNPLLVFGGGGVLAALLGYFGFSAWRGKREEGAAVEPVSQLTEGDLTANSVFGTTGGQSVDTSGSSIQSDFSHSAVGAIDTDEGVDPVAEADVYMAYGRDAQAEEILLDAVKHDPERLAIRVKLLEIYAGRKSVKPFETLASEVYGRTGGAGPDWDKVAAMGRELDPDNPLFASKLAADAEATPAGAAAPAVQAFHERDTLTLPGQFARMAAAAPVEAAPESTAEEVLPRSLDFDLDLDLGSAADEPAVEAPAAPAAPVGGIDFDLDFDPLATLPAAGLMAKADARQPVMEALDFDLDFEPPAAADAAPAAEQPSGLEFDFGVAAKATAAPQIDFSAIDLELTPSAPPVAETPPADSSPYQEAATKLELAQAYEEMGDREGARDLLNEVLAEGNDGQKESAREKLAALA